MPTHICLVLKVNKIIKTFLYTYESVTLRKYIYSTNIEGK